jgi:predicted phosphodiesterase
MFNESGEIAMNISANIPDDVLVYCEDKDNNILTDYSTITKEECNFVKFLTNDNNTAIQNILPEPVNHLGLYDGENKIGNVYLTKINKTGIITEESDSPLLTLGFLSDVHFSKRFEDESIVEKDAMNDFSNAINYFNDNHINDVYISGDVSETYSYDMLDDLEDFNIELNNLLIDNNEPKLEYTHNVYIVRGNHDVACLVSGGVNPNDMDDNHEFTDEDREEAYLLDSEWNLYVQNNLKWQHYYYSPINEPEDDVACNSCGYNIYEYNDLKLVIFSLPLYSNNFWNRGMPGYPAYMNEELYNLETAMREFYNKDNTEIIVIVHVPFDNLTGNYKDCYVRDNSSSSNMEGYYLQSQYNILKRLHDTYKGVIWIEGHTHFKYEMQGDKKPVYHYETDGYFNNANVSCYDDVFDIHISSCGYPREVTRSGTQNRSNAFTCKDESQGAVFNIYKDYIDIKGISFKGKNDTTYSNKIVPIGMYRLYFIKNKQVVPNRILNYDGETNNLSLNEGEI